MKIQNLFLEKVKIKVDGSCVFLFAMGAAFPFSIGKRYAKGETKVRLIYDALKRGVQLTFFAIFIQHFYPYVLNTSNSIYAWLLAICCFAVLFPMFMRIPLPLKPWMHSAIKWGAYIVAALMIYVTQPLRFHPFTLYDSNIIILLLANMAVFGSVLYIFTMNNKWLRSGILLLLWAIFCSSTESVWTQSLFEFTPFAWMYRFEYLKYLFIVIPGSFAGEYLYQWIEKKNDISYSETTSDKAIGSLMISFLLIIVNLFGLYNRWLTLNLIISILLLLIGYSLLRNPKGSAVLWRQLFLIGAFLLLLGLFLEPFQGGIKKDPASFGYLFVTSGLGCMALIFFHVICDYYKKDRACAFLIMSGQNPMIAYVAGDLFLIPLLCIIGVMPLINAFNANPWLGFLKGVLLTSGAMLITMFFTKIKWFWRT